MYNALAFKLYAYQSKNGARVNMNGQLTAVVEILADSKPDGRGEGFMLLRYPR